MRSLRTIRYDVCSIVAEVAAAAWDTSRDEVLVAFGPSESEPRVQLARVVDQSTLKCRDLASWDALSPSPDISVDRIVSLHYFGDMATACVVMAGGDIVMAREETAGNGDAHIEIVGSVDPGISAARWSYDEEVLALVTLTGKLLLMSRNFETIGETSMTPADLAQSRHVSVGWGKKETQFRGRGARAMRDPTIPETVDQGTLSLADDGVAITISWRGDGEYVAVNAIEKIEDAGNDTASTATTSEQNSSAAEPKQRRVVRVYNREGVLDSVSEPVDGLGSSLAWRPSGNLMATIQRLPAKENYNVIFFERNGLRHGQFALRPPVVKGTTAVPVSLAWNADSTVLAVTYDTAIQLWTMANYHWYLKQELVTRPRKSIMAWHPEKPLNVATAASDGLIIMENIFATARGSMSPPYDHGSVAVIDGNTVKFTPFRLANVPPPMSRFDIAVESTAVDVAFAPKDEALAVLHSRGIDLFALPWPVTNSTRLQQPKPLTSVSFSSENRLEDFVPLQVSFFQEHEQTSVVGVLGWKGELYTVLFEVSSKLDELILTKEIRAHRGSVFVTSSRSDCLFIQDTPGALSQVDYYNKTVSRSHMSLPNLILPWAEVVAIDGEGAQIVVGLSRNGNLYANDRQLTKGCTSFLVTPDHIVLTTNNHLLKFIHLTEAHDLEVPSDDPEIDERCRSIERGGRLVTSIPENMSVVLQMPRGNLETIFPRAMVVAGIRKLIDSLNYKSAFAVCRTQRVDMNILCDYKRDQFLSNVGLFLTQLEHVTSIDLFLSSLKEEDVTETMYKDTKPARASKDSGLGFGIPHAMSMSESGVVPPAKAHMPKVNSICNAVLAGLVSRKKTNLQNIITAHVCKSPPALDDGLRVVVEIMKENAKTAEQAVEHICFLADANRLYDHALGLYDLELTLLVAQQAQRDPREYVPFVQSFHEMPELHRRFSIDDHLGRYNKALGHLVEINDFDHVVEYIKKHVLYKTALGLYRYEKDRLATVTNAYAGYLETQSKFREAGLAYESLGNFAKAMGCYQSAGVSCWRECVFAAESLVPPPSEEFLKELAAILADALFEAKDYTAAATLHLDYLGSVESAARCLCKGYEFAEAMRVVVVRQRTDLLEAAVDPGLAEALSSSTELLADCRSQLKAQVPRILELHAKAMEDPLGFYEGERQGGEDVPDDLSVAASSRISTSASLFTRYSSGTVGTGKTGETGGSRTTQIHRNRKKREEKKRARGRKGTVYEQEYLINSVRRLVERVERARPEVARLVFGLTRRNMAERARAIENLMAELIEACQSAIGEIWGPDGANHTAPAHSSIARIGGSMGEANGGHDAKDVQPTIAAFEKLSLLG